MAKTGQNSGNNFNFLKIANSSFFVSYSADATDRSRPRAQKSRTWASWKILENSRPRAKAAVQTANESSPSHHRIHIWKMGEKSRWTHSWESNWEPEKSRLVPTVNSPLKSRRWPEFLFNVQRSWKEKKNSKEGFSLTSFCLFSDFSRVFFHRFQVCFYFQRFHEFFCSSISSFHLCPFQIKSSLEQRSEIGNLEKSEKKAKI